MEVYPSLAFDSLFDNRGQQRNRSVLDRVKEQLIERGVSVEIASAEQQENGVRARVRLREPGQGA